MKSQITSAAAHQEAVRRYASLRGAQRALAPSMRPPEWAQTSEMAKALRNRLAQVRAEAEAAPAPGEEGAKPSDEHPLAGDLERLSTALLAVVDGLGLAQLRATLPQVNAEHREEVEALLDLCLEGPEGVARRAHLVDYLVTLLSTEERDGERRIVRSPCAVSERVRRLCKAADRSSRPEHMEVERAFREAAAEVREAADVSPVVERMRARKEQLPDCFFVRGVLESLVDYNVSVWNRMRALLATERDLDLEVDEIEEEPLLETSEAAPEAEELAPEEREPAGSALEAPGIGAISAALRARLMGSVAGESAAARVAGALDITQLNAWECQAFYGGEEEGPAPLVRAAVAVAAAVHAFGSQDQALAALGIYEDSLRREWVQELNGLIQTATQHCVKDGDFDTSRLLAKTKSKFLYEPLMALAREREPEPPAVPVEAESETEELEEGEGYDEAAPATYARKKKKKKGRARRSGGNPMVRNLKRGFAAVALVGGLAALLVLYRPDPARVKEFDAVELKTISPYLAGGYRSRQGDGRVFVGTLTEAWGKADAEAREAAADKIQKVLANGGVDETMLFDSRRRLMAHYVGGKPRHVPMANP